MQFLFVILMSVIVGSSALPHVMQAPNRPSFSLRKNTSFSLVAIPKFFQTVASLERKIAGLEEEQKRKKLAFEESKRNESALSLSEPEENNGESALQEAGDSEESNQPVRERGGLIVDNVDLQSCVCKEDGMMDCYVFLEGYCSHEGKFVTSTVKLENGEVLKNFRCKDQNYFSGSIQVSGKGVGIVSIKFMDQQYEQNINMINYCGQLGTSDALSEED